MAKRQSKQEKIDAARIQRAINQLQIPMLRIPALYKVAQQAIAAGANDEQLREQVKSFLKV